MRRGWKPWGCFAVAALGGALAGCQRGAGPPPPPSYGLDWPTVARAADGFALRLPPRWEPVPGPLLEDMCIGAGSRRFDQGVMAPIDYRCAFQEGPVRRWFGGPYLLVDVRPGRRPAWAEMAALPRLDDAALPMRPDGARGVFAAMTPRSVLHEPGAGVVWVSLGDGLAAAPGMGAFAAIFPTQRGVIQLDFYAPALAREAYMDLFERIARAARIDPAIRYRTCRLESVPGFSRLDWSRPGMRWCEMGLVACAAGALGGLCRALVRRAEIEEANPLNAADAETGA